MSQVSTAILRNAIFALACAFALLDAPQSVAQDYFGGFEGTWEGSVKPIQSAALGQVTRSNRPIDGFRIQITGSTPKVFFRRGADAWREVKPGAFRLVIHKTTAVLYAVTSASDTMNTTGSGGWVESWVFNITHKDRKTLFVYWTSSVNNYLRPAEHKDERGPIGRFFSSAFGELSLIEAR